MCAAIVRASYASGVGPTLANAETGAKYNLEETLAGSTTPVSVPTATGTNFSWSKTFRLEVTTLDAATSLTNLRHNISAAPATGMKLWFRNDATTYARSTAVAAASSGTNDSTPAGYTAAPTTATVYDAGSFPASSVGGKGSYLSLTLGVSNLYAGGGGSAIALPSLLLIYDEI
ncbi:MAG: hypothetical protein ACR2OE_07495 [Thermomicrobiales bacterium]